ncbi:MAG: OsmC family protein [Chlamydiae bacterium]|nr:OsmC family protein [Chlamydiota bacterium]
MSKMKLHCLSDLRIECDHLDSKSKIILDAPKEVGGRGSSFSPSDLIATGLGSCVLVTMGMVAKRVGFSMEGVTAEVEKIMVKEPKRRISKIIIRIRCPNVPSSHILEKLENSAKDCVVHASIHPDIKQEIDFIWGI